MDFVINKYLFVIILFTLKYIKYVKNKLKKNQERHIDLWI